MPLDAQIICQDSNCPIIWYVQLREGERAGQRVQTNDGDCKEAAS